MTIELRVPLDAALTDELVAELAESGFDAFQHEKGTLKAWGPAGAWNDATRASLKAWLVERAPGVRPVVVRIPDQNWNELWEASVEPVAAGPFVVLPTWANPAEEHRGLLPLRIDPKMSFGTGHHASTRLALGLLATRVREGERVLDVGAGTGILALGALTLGASTAVGCDIDPWSVPNARECAAINGLAGRFEMRLGDLDVVPETGFGLVVANIIRSVLVPMLPELVRRMNRDGSLVLAGLLASERDVVIAAAGRAGLDLDGESVEGEWWAGAWSVVSH